MENTSRGPTFEDFFTILNEGSMQDNTVARLQSTKVQTPLSHLSIKCNVLRQSISEDSQKYSLRNTKEKGTVEYLWFLGTFLSLLGNHKRFPSCDISLCSPCLDRRAR
jgi:hypothetical protein